MMPAILMLCAVCLASGVAPAPSDAHADATAQTPFASSSAALSTVLATGPDASLNTAHPDAPPHPSDGCQGVMDSTWNCVQVADEHMALEDPSPSPQRGDLNMDDRPTLSIDVAVVGLGLATVGAAALAISFAPALEPRVVDAVRTTAVTLLIGAGLVGSSALALWAFDPVTGTMRRGDASGSEHRGDHVR